MRRMVPKTVIRIKSAPTVPMSTASSLTFDPGEIELPDATGHEMCDNLMSGNPSEEPLWLYLFSYRRVPAGNRCTLLTCSVSSAA